MIKRLFLIVSVAFYLEQILHPFLGTLIDQTNNFVDIGPYFVFKFLSVPHIDYLVSITDSVHNTKLLFTSTA